MVIAACYIDPNESISLPDLERFFKCINCSVNSCDLLRLIKSVSTNPDNHVSFHEFLRFQDFKSSIFQPIRDIREVFQFKIFRYEVYNAIKHRRKNINKIRNYYDDNGRFPPRSCNDIIRGGLLDTPHPYKYDYIIENGNFAGTIGQLIYKYTSKYKPQSIRLKELKGIKPQSSIEPSEKVPGSPKSDDENESGDENESESESESNSGAGESNEMNRVQEKIKRLSIRNSLTPTPIIDTKQNVDNLTPRSRLAISVGVPRSYRSFQADSLCSENSPSVSNCSPGKLHVMSAMNVKSKVINVEPKKSAWFWIFKLVI